MNETMFTLLLVYLFGLTIAKWLIDYRIPEIPPRFHDHDSLGEELCYHGWLLYVVVLILWPLMVPPFAVFANIEKIGKWFGWLAEHVRDDLWSRIPSPLGEGITEFYERIYKDLT